MPRITVWRVLFALGECIAFGVPIAMYLTLPKLHNAAGIISFVLMYALLQLFVVFIALIGLFP